MTSARISRIHRGLIAALVTIYIVAGIAGVFANAVENKVLWVLFLVGGAALIMLGAVVRNVPPRLTVALISIGAFAGAIVLLPTVIVPIAAAVLVAMTFSLSRRSPAS